MKQRIGMFTFLPSLWRLFLTMLTIVFIAEAAVMFLLPVLLPSADRFVVSTADAVMLTILIAPFLWWFIVRPLRNTALVEHLRATVISRAIDGIITINDQGLVESFNPAAERLFGYQEAEVVGKPMTVMMPERYRDAHRIGLERVRSPGQSETIGNTREVHGLRKDGCEFPLELSLASWDTGKGKFHIGILRDITERKQAEAMLRESETRYRTLFEQLPDGALIIDPETTLPIEFNHAAHRQLGYSREEFARLRVFDYEAAEKSEETKAHIEKVLREGREDFETRHRTKEGGIRDIRVIVQTIWLSGQPYFYGIFHDITERKQAEATRHALYSASLEIQEPLKLQERLDRILQVARDILRPDRLSILLADPAGQWLEAVASLPSGGEEGVEEPLAAIRVQTGPEGGALAMAYRTRQAVVWDGRAPLPDSLRLQPPYDQIEALRSRIFAVVPLVVQGRAIGVLWADREHTHRALDVDTLEMLQIFTAQAAIAIEHGRLYEVQRMAAIQLEATVEHRTLELRVTNGKLVEASSHKSEFLAHMSHELRTPLNAILGFSDLLQDPTFGALSEKQARYLTHIHASGKHLLALINDLLDLSKVEAGRLDLRPEPFALPEALTAALYEIQPLADHKRLTLTLDADTGPATLTADPVRFKQILYNLLSNAVKFTPEGGRIVVTARVVRSAEERTSDLASHTGEFVEIAVIDTGIGITAEDVPKLFQRFTQLEPTIAKAHHGTGLGLAITKQLVELHEGQIVASSLGAGHGSTFTMRLPLHPSTRD